MFLFILFFVYLITVMYTLSCFDDLLAFVRRAAPEVWEAEGKPTSFGGRKTVGASARIIVSMKWLAEFPESLCSDPEAMRRLNKYRVAFWICLCLGVIVFCTIFWNPK